MKKLINLLLAVSFMLIVLTGCNAIKDALVINVDFQPADIEFSVNESGMPVDLKNISRAPAVETVLLDRTVDINVAKELEKKGASIENIKSFLLLEATLTLIPGEFTSVDINLNVFKGVKLYLDDTNTGNLVAKVKSVDNAEGTITLEVVKAELLDKLTDDSIHIIITNDNKPAYKAKFKLKNKFRAKVGMK